MHAPTQYLQFAYSEARRRLLCPRGWHGEWHYFGTRTRICPLCHMEQWRYPHAEPEWQEPPHKFAESVSAHEEGSPDV